MPALPKGELLSFEADPSRDDTYTVGALGHTEIDMFSGALMRMGKELGIPTPYNEYTYHMIKAMEEKNDGLFDYDGTEEPTWAK